MARNGEPSPAFKFSSSRWIACSGFMAFLPWVMADQFEQRVPGAYQRLPATGHAGLQQAAFVEGNKQSSEILGGLGGKTDVAQLCGQRRAQTRKATRQGCTDCHILGAAFQGHRGQRATALELAAFQLLQGVV